MRSDHCWSQGRGRPSASFQAGSCTARARASRDSVTPSISSTMRWMLFSGWASVRPSELTCTPYRNRRCRASVTPYRSRVISSQSAPNARILAISSTKRTPALTKKEIRCDHVAHPLGRHLAGVAHRVEHGDGGGQGEADLLHRRRAGLLEVVRADVDRVPLRHLAQRVGDDVGGEPQRRRRREDVRPPGQVLLDDVVLRGAGAARQLGALLGGDRAVEGEQPHRRRVDGHRGVHVGERDAVEERPHVAEVRHRHADPAHLAGGQLVVRVVPGLGGQVEGDRQAGLPLRQVAAEECVGRRGGGVPGVRAHHPGAVALRQPARESLLVHGRSLSYRSVKRAVENHTGPCRGRPGAERPGWSRPPHPGLRALAARSHT